MSRVRNGTISVSCRSSALLARPPGSSSKITQCREQSRQDRHWNRCLCGRSRAAPSVRATRSLHQGTRRLGLRHCRESIFSGGTADSQFRSLDLSLTETADLAALVSGLRYTEPSDPAASPDLLKAARSLADQAITAANTQLRSSRQERAAHEFAASPFRQAVSDIAGWVASKGRARPNASYDDLLKSMTSTPPTPADGQPADAVPLSAIDRFRNSLSLNPPRTSADLISAIGQSSQLLTSASIELQGNTPPYGARLTKVTKCATDLPSG